MLDYSNIASLAKRKIKKQLTALGEAERCFPIDIFSTSRLIADTNDSEYCRSLILQYGNHANAFVRQAMLVAIRYIGGDFPATVREHVLHSLNDENHWVIYHAAWILKDFGITSSDDFVRLRLLAGELLNMPPSEIDNLKPMDPEEYAAKMAAQAIIARQVGAAKAASQIR